MIITRTPLRITLGGGGTDIPSYYRRAGTGFLVAAAISKYVYIAVNETFDQEILLKYSQLERVGSPDEVQHPLLRECLRMVGIDRAIEITSMADIPSGTGLGSSGAFAVGLLKALHAFEHRSPSNESLAEEACHVEIDRLGEPVGKQDQYIAALGGLAAFEFRSDDTVVSKPIGVPKVVRAQLEENLLLFFTRGRRDASAALRSERARGDVQPGELDDNLTAVRELGHETHDALLRGDLDTFGKLLTRQWELKFERAPSDLHREIDQAIRAGIESGALGGKLVGAGGGGFLLFYAEDKVALRATMARLGMDETRFSFDAQGASTLVSS